MTLPPDMAGLKGSNNGVKTDPSIICTAFLCASFGGFFPWGGSQQLQAYTALEFSFPIIHSSRFLELNDRYLTWLITHLWTGLDTGINSIQIIWVKNWEDKERSTWQNRRTWRSPPPTNTSKICLHVKIFSQNTYLMLAEDLTQPKLQERPLYNQVGQKKTNVKRESIWGLHLWVGAVKEQRFPHHGYTFHQLRDKTGQTGSFRGSEESAAALLSQTEQSETSITGLSHFTAFPSPEKCVCWCMRRRGAENQASVDRSGEKTEAVCVEIAWRGCSIVWAAIRSVHKMEHWFTIAAPLLTPMWREGGTSP